MLNHLGISTEESDISLIQTLQMFTNKGVRASALALCTFDLPQRRLDQRVLGTRVRVHVHGCACARMPAMCVCLWVHAITVRVFVLSQYVCLCVRAISVVPSEFGVMIWLQGQESGNPPVS